MNRMLIGLLSLSIVLAVRAETEPAENISIHGFSTLNLAKPSGKNMSATRGHTWLTLKQPVSKTVEIVIAVTPLGPPKLVHNAFVIVKRPLPGITAITAGRFVPPLGYEFPSYRPDQVPTGAYGLTSNFAVARDQGIQIALIPAPHVEATGAVFAGYRTGGNVPVAKRGEPDGYIRLQAKPVRGLLIGTSARLGPVPVRAAHAALDYGHAHTAGEIMRSHDETRWYVLASYAAISWLVPAARYDHIASTERVTLGASVKIPGGHEAKSNFAVQGGNRTISAQFIGRW